jgi:hypothetical protein
MQKYNQYRLHIYARINLILNMYMYIRIQMISLMHKELIKAVKNLSGDGTAD